jgi:hypothetical protein
MYVTELVIRAYRIWDDDFQTWRQIEVHEAGEPVTDELANRLLKQARRDVAERDRQQNAQRSE